MPHRNVAFGTTDAERPEAYSLTVTADAVTMSATPINKPKSMFFRGVSGTRFMNFANIKDNSTTGIAGNYSKDYQIIQTTGRGANNRYFVETTGSWLSENAVQSSHISGVVDFEIPERTRAEHIITNRFNAIGGPETTTLTRDRETEEYSIYNTVNYRNSIPRAAKNILSREHAEQFGYRSGSSTQGSIHKINRNPQRFLLGAEEAVRYDNEFVQHSIPQSDYQYSWVANTVDDDVYNLLKRNDNRPHVSNHSLKYIEYSKDFSQETIGTLPSGWSTIRSEQTASYTTMLTASSVTVTASGGSAIFPGAPLVSKNTYFASENRVYKVIGSSELRLEYSGLKPSSTPNAAAVHAGITSGTTPRVAVIRKDDRSSLWNPGTSTLKLDIHKSSSSGWALETGSLLAFPNDTGSFHFPYLAEVKIHFDGSSGSRILYLAGNQINADYVTHYASSSLGWSNVTGSAIFSGSDQNKLGVMDWDSIGDIGVTLRGINNSQPRAHFFRYNGTTSAYEVVGTIHLTSSDDITLAEAPRAVKLHSEENLMVVSYATNDLRYSSLQGVVRVYFGINSSSWGGNFVDITCPIDDYADNFGHSIDFDGSFLAIGSPGTDLVYDEEDPKLIENDQGAAFLYKIDTLTNEVILQHSFLDTRRQQETNANFGRSLTLFNTSQKLLVVESPGEKYAFPELQVTSTHLSVFNLQASVLKDRSLSGSLVAGSGSSLAVVMKGEAITALEIPQFPTEFRDEVGDFFRVFETSSPITQGSSEFTVDFEVMQGSDSSSDISNSVYGATSSPTSSERLLTQYKIGSSGNWKTLVETTGDNTTLSTRQNNFYKLSSIVVENPQADDVYIRMISNTRTVEDVYWAIKTVTLKNTSNANRSAEKLIPNSVHRKDNVRDVDYNITVLDFVDPYFSELNNRARSWENTGGSSLYWGTSSIDFPRTLQAWLKPKEQPVLASGELEAFTVSYSIQSAEASSVAGTGTYPVTPSKDGWFLNTIYTDQGKIRFRFIISSTYSSAYTYQYYIETKQEYDADKWYHVVVTYDGQKATTVEGLKMYINSSKVEVTTNRDQASGEYPGMNNQDTSFGQRRLQLGCGNANRQTRKAYFGKMAHVAVFGKELSASEVGTLYSLRNNVDENYSILTDPFALLQSSLSSDTLAYWPLNKKNKEIYEDSSTSHYHIYRDIVLGATLASEDPDVNEGSFRLAPSVSGDVLERIAGTQQEYQISNYTTREVGDERHYLKNVLSPYSYTSWTQLRSGETAVARRQRRDNKLTISVRGKEVFPSSMSRYYHDMNPDLSLNPVLTTADTPRTTEVYDEVSLSSRYRPLVITMNADNIGLITDPPANTIRIVSQNTLDAYWEDNESFATVYSPNISRADSRLIVVKASAPNDLSMFSNDELNDRLELDEHKRHNISQIIGGMQGLASAEGSTLEICYKETIYPREVNTFTRKARLRTEFDYFSWRDARNDRQLTLSGSNQYGAALVNFGNSSVFPDIVIDREDNKETNHFFVDSRNISDRFSSSPSTSKIMTSRWPLDARTQFSSLPTNIEKSYHKQGDLFLTDMELGTKGEGSLQNDYSIFGLGYNGLYGTPPVSALYNRRIPQSYSGTEYLAGEAQWDAPSQSGRKPYENSNETTEKLKRLWQDHSLVPEYKVSEFVEDMVLNHGSDFSKVVDKGDYLSVTGAVYHTSSQEVTVGSRFFKTYGTSEFMKYFGMTLEEVANNNIGGPSQITLKCNAAIKFTPYRGFYPAERTLQIGEIFSRGYMPDFSIVDERQTAADRIQVTSPEKMMKRKIRANLQQTIKPFMAPGILYNSIKSGMAVDYPVFGSSTDETALSAFDTAIKAQLEPFTTFDSSLNSLVTFTGSAVNNTQDSGIPRLSGSVTRRIAFEDLLDPQRIIGEKIFDNEPHPSASIYYGDGATTKVFDYPFQFGQLNADNNQSKLFAGNFSLDKTLDDTLTPYKMAINNFCAETVNFFLEGGKLASLESDQVNPNLVSGSDYKMRVYVKNNSLVMYDRHSAFGPPVDEGDMQVTQISGTAATQPGIGAHALLGTPLVTIAASSIGAGTTNFIVEDTSGNTIKIAFISGSTGTDITTGSSGPSNSFNYDVSRYGRVYVNNLTSSIDLASIENSSELTSVSINKLMEVAVNHHRWSGSFGIEANFVDQDLRLRQLVTGSSGNTTIVSTGSISSLYPDFPSVFVSGAASTTNFTGVTTSQVIQSSSHEYAPFVPPYLDQGAEPYVEITFTPSESRVHSLEEILQGSQYQYVNFKDIPSNAGSNTNYKNAMSVSASLDLSNFVAYTEQNNQDPGTTLEQRKRWIIQTKWETPILNFRSAAASALNLSSSTVVSVTGSPWQSRTWNQYLTTSVLNAPEQYLTASTGMWHQYGSLLDSNEGYTISIRKVDGVASDLQLAKKVGFIGEDLKPVSTTPGLIAEKKEISEAVVAIPFYVDSSGDKMRLFTVKDRTLKQAKTMNKKQKSEYEQAIQGLNVISEQYRAEREEYLNFYNNPGLTGVESVAYQLRMMEKFVFPPQFDYYTYPSLSQKPMMYVFQFNAEFTRQDLANIWQNLSPSSVKSGASARGSSVENPEINGMRQDVQYVTNFLTKKNLPFSQRKAFFEKDVRWLIFKVKQRAEVDLSKVKMQSLPGSQNNLTIDNARTSIKPSDYLENKKYSYNWPYDYFSLVELIKVEGKVSFSPMGSEGNT